MSLNISGLFNMMRVVVQVKDIGDKMRLEYYLELQQIIRFQKMKLL